MVTAKKSERFPHNNPKDMSEDLRAKFRYDLRHGMTYEALCQKYLVTPAMIVEEKRLLGLPVRIKASNRARKPAVTASEPPSTTRDPRQIAASLRRDVSELAGLGFTVTIDGADVRIVRSEVL